jgi:hypothetical protein
MTVLDGEPDPDGRLWMSAEDARRLGGELVGLQQRLAAKEAECAALADALGNPAVTHDYVLYPRFPHRCDVAGCALSPDAPVHRTPAVVRAEMEARP